MFVCCHKEDIVPEHELLFPIQVGAALHEKHFPYFLHDDTGENISSKNRSYCELTAQYWAWKNVTTDYYGFFHYRRYLSPDTRSKHTYRIEGPLDSAAPGDLNIDMFRDLAAQYDLIIPRGEDMHVPVREHYANAPHHHKKDLELAERILLEQHPEAARAAEAYLSGSVCYFGNIYIMSKPLFHSYCGWLFPILEEFDRRADLSGYSQQALRVDGYLAERLLGVYVFLLRESGRYAILELPRVHWVQDKTQRIKQRLQNLLLPPGSLRRAKIKGLLRIKHD